MKLSFVCGRADSAGRHNDRNFDTSITDHIKPELSKNNIYWTYNGDVTKSFRDLELEFYELNFGQHLEEQNKRHLAARHKNRCKTLKGYYTDKNTRPEDVIIQIGNVNEHVSAEQLWDVASDYITQFNDKYGDHCLILDAALHDDEETIDVTGKKIKGTPHVHLRRVWLAEDKDGHKCVSQNKALQDIGLLPDNMKKDFSVENNNKVSFIKRERADIEKLCVEKGINIERGSWDRGEHLTVAEYKLKKDLEKIDALSDRLSKTILSHDNTIERDERYIFAKDQKPRDKVLTLLEILNEKKESDLMSEQSLALQELERYKRQYRKLLEFIKKRNKKLYKEYKETELEK